MSSFVNILPGFIESTSIFIKSKLYPAKLKVHNQPTSTYCEPVVESVVEAPVENSSECVTPNDSSV